MLMGDRLPVFVYGTLRNGQRNYSLLAGRTAAEYPARADGLVLFGQRIPFAVERDGGVVVGELMVLDDDHYEQAMVDLDGLERYYEDRLDESLYVRVIRSVRYQRLDGDWETTKAWLYLVGAAAAGRYHEGELVPDGDWVRSQAG